MRVPRGISANHASHCNQLRKNLESLDPVRVAGKIECAQKSAVRAINERDCARRRAEEWKEANRKLKEQVEALKDRFF